MELNNFIDPRASFSRSSRLGTDHKSKARINGIRRDAQESRDRMEQTFSSNPHYSGKELSKRRNQNKLERKIYGGIAATAIAATGLLAATSQPRGEVNPVNPNQESITKQANDNKNMANAIDHEANQTQPQQIDQADIERFQHQQTELHRPADK